MILCVAFGVTACSHVTSPDNPLAALPEQWQTTATQRLEPLTWSGSVSSSTLNELVITALNNSPDMRQSRLDFKVSGRRLAAARLDSWPQLSARLAVSRANSIFNRDVYRTQLDASLDLSYELNLWGQLSDERRSAAYGYAAQEAIVQQTELIVASRVARAWFDILEAFQLMELYVTRLKNLDNNLAIIEAGYRNGLNRTLDVYLTRNDVEREKSRIALQTQVLADAQRSLSVLLGDYPHSARWQTADFPEFAVVSSAKLPSELLTHKPDIQAAWLDVLRQNAELAIAHKARFPSLRLSARIRRSGEDFRELSQNTNPVWNVAGSLIQPIFSAGRLKNTEDIARLQLESAEIKYIDTVNKAFFDVEAALQRQQSLHLQQGYTQQSAHNAHQAETLAFEQYLKGLVSYTTVLDSQRRAVDANIQLISIKKQIAVNKVNLFQLLAGQLDL